MSQLAPAATKQPIRAIALGKRASRYLAGTRDHGIAMRASGGSPGRTHHAERCGGAPILERFGGASYEEGYAQTGVVIKLHGVTV